MSPADQAKKLKKARELRASGQPLQALNLYTLLAEKNPDAYGEYGCAAAESGDLGMANRLWEKFRQRVAQNGAALSWLANECGKVGLNAKSQTLWNEAANIQPNNLELHLNRASMLAKSSGVQEARQAVNECLELDPQNEKARFLSVHLDRRENKLAEAEQQVRKLLDSNLAQPEVLYSCYAELAHILDRSERFDEAMAALEKGKNIVRRFAGNAANWQRSFEDYLAEVNQVKSVPKDALLAWNKAYPPAARNTAPPVTFLSGSARSGTTLLERVLDAHPSVAACDETMAFSMLKSRIDISGPVIPAQRLNVLREMYVRNMATILGMSITEKTLLDKNPSRTTWLPAFLRIFPELHVLIALRDPRDIMISIYFQDLESSNTRLSRNWPSDIARRWMRGWRCANGRG